MANDIASFLIEFCTEEIGKMSLSKGAYKNIRDRFVGAVEAVALCYGIKLNLKACEGVSQVSERAIVDMVRYTLKSEDMHRAFYGDKLQNQKK